MPATGRATKDVMSIALSLVAGVLLILVIIAVNGYFVAQEFAFMAVDRSRLKAQAAEGDRAAQRALEVTQRTSFMLSGAQLGITVTGLLVGYVAEPLVGTAIGELLGGAGVPTAVGISIGTITTLVAATFVQMLFAELFPKNLAIARPYPVARRLAGSTLVYMRLAGWLIHVFDQSSNLLLRVLRIEPVHDVEHSANPRDLQRIVSASREARTLPAELSLLLDRLLDFPERDVEHALVPRARVDVIPDDLPLEEVRARMDGGHSRYPVLGPEGEIRGVVHLGDLLEALARAPRPQEMPSAADVMRAAVVVPELMRLPDALSELTRRGEQLACVVDEHGGFSGIVTVEDLVEEVVGEITDEHDGDEEPHLVAETRHHHWIVRGDAPLDEVERELGHAVPRSDYETVAGLAIAQLGGLPEPGTVVEVELPLDPADLARADEPPLRLLRLEVLTVEHHVPASLRLELVDPDDPDGPDGPDGPGPRLPDVAAHDLEEGAR